MTTENSVGDNKRIAFILSSLIVGGSERKTVRLANTLFCKGWDVHVICVDGPRRSQQPLLGAIKKGIKIVCLDRIGLYSFPALFRLRRYVIKNRIGRIIGVNRHSLAYAVPVIMSIRSMRPRLLALINTTTFMTNKQSRTMVLYKQLMNCADVIVFGCEHQMRKWVQMYSLNNKKCTYIYNGVDLSEYTFRDKGKDIKECEEIEGLSVLGTVGQLRPVKNHRELITAVYELVKKGYAIRLMLVGDGDERDNLIENVKSLGLQDNVEFCGQVSDVKSKLEKMDIFVLTSSSETFSNAALEAMAMGLPVVMSRVGGAGEMVVNEYNGFLYESGRPEELVDILESMINNPPSWSRLGANGAKMVREKFNHDRMVRDFEQLLEY